MTLCGLAIPKNLTFQPFPGGQEKQTSVTQDSALFQKKKCSPPCTNDESSLFGCCVV